MNTPCGQEGCDCGHTIEKLYRTAQDCFAQAVAMMTIFKKTDIPWDWKSTDQALMQAADVLIEARTAIEEEL